VAITYVGKGAPADGYNYSPPQPALPAGLAVHDLMVLYFYGQWSEGQSIGVGAGWTPLWQRITGVDQFLVWYRFVQPGETAPAIEWNDEFGAVTTRGFAQIAAWRGVKLSAPSSTSAIASGSTYNRTGPIAGIPYTAGGLVLLVTSRRGSVGSPAVEGVTAPTMSEIESPNFVTGIAGSWWYGIAGGAPGVTGDLDVVYGDAIEAEWNGALASFDAGTGFHPALAANYRRRR